MNSHQDFELPSQQQTRDALRAEFPACAQAVDEMQAIFGKVRVLAMSENGREHKIKKYDQYQPAVELTASQYERLGQISEENRKFVEGNTGAKRK